jgi:MYXO-CTERM domain-containing protein
MLAVGKDYDDSYFGEDGQTYLGASGEALFGWDCGGGHGTYLQDGCTGSGAKDCRDPAGAIDGCPDYRNCCTSSVWVGQMLSALMLGAKSVWNHDAYFDYVDRWMTGDVSGGDGSNAFAEAMWALYRDDLPELATPPACGADMPGDGGASGGTTGSGGASGTEPDSGVASGGRAASTGGAATTTGGRSATGSSGGASGTSDAGAAPPQAASDDSGCGCRVPSGEASSKVPWLLGLLLAVGLSRKKRIVRA